MTSLDSLATNRRRSDVFTPENTAATLEAACRVVGLDATGARLLRLGSNAVYRLREPVVARISRRQDGERDAAKSVAVARWLESIRVAQS